MTVSLESIWADTQIIPPPPPRPPVTTDETEQQLELERQRAEEALARGRDRVEKSIERRLGGSKRRMPREPWRGQTLFLEYVDARDQYTARRVNILDIRHEFDLFYIDAWCHERKAHRQFRADRILSLANCVTGETFDSLAEWLASLEPVPSGIISDDDAGKSAWPQVADGCTLLMYLARIDGRIDRSEEMALAQWIFATLDKHTTAAATYCTRLARGLAPSQAEFMASLYRVAATSLSKRGALIDASRKLVDADGSLDGQEANLIEKLTASLK